jgi:hypothetical protein
MKTKNTFRFYLILITLYSLFLSCNKEDSNSTQKAGTADFGNFVGSLKVTNDTQTNLGFIYNVKVSIIAIGSDVVIKIVGDESFDREYTGTILSTSGANGIINIKKQTKPTEKTAGNQIVISNNSLATDINLIDDSVVTKESPTSNSTTTITGKIKISGTNLLRQL